MFPGGVNSPVRFYHPYPVFIEQGKGSRLRDVDGNEYVDFILSYGPSILGHAPPEVISAIRSAAGRGTIFGAPTDLEVRYGELLQKSSGLDLLRIVNTGSEATLHAIRLALHYTGRKRILKMDGGYHGTHPYGLPSERVTQVPFNSADDVKKELSTGDYACLIMEPVMGNIGVIPPEDGFLEEIREITDKTETLLIFDEVITGYRTGFQPFFRRRGVQPDLATFAKIVGGGLPLGIYGGRDDIMHMVSPSGDFSQAGTFSANPVSLAAGLAALITLQRSDYGYLERLTHLAVKILSKSGLTVNSETGMLSLFFTEDRVTRASQARKSRTDLYLKLFRSALSHGIVIPPSAAETMFISFAHTEDEVVNSFTFLAEEAERLWKKR